MTFSSRKRVEALLAWFLLVGVCAVFFFANAFSDKDVLEVVFFDVGQGDSIFIETPRAYQILIDGGPDAAVLEKLGATMPWWDRSLDLVILTHPDKDHIAGLIDVLGAYDVAAIVTSGAVKDTGVFHAWETAVAQEGAEIIVIDSEKRLAFEAGTAIEFLWPKENISGEAVDKPNEYSLVARLTHGETSMLFTGDLERWGEQQLLAAGALLASDVLKVPHHGSKTSTSELFLRAVSPDIAVISVGKDNPYGHPVAAVLDRLAAYGVEVVRTDERGDIRFLVREGKLEVEP